MVPFGKCFGDVQDFTAQGFRFPVRGGLGPFFVDKGKPTLDAHLHGARISGRAFHLPDRWIDL